MADSGKAAIESTVENLIKEVGTWPGVTTGEHRFGGTEWRVGPREIGHVHAWGMLDITQAGNPEHYGTDEIRHGPKPYPRLRLFIRCETTS